MAQRHKAREYALQMLFQWEIGRQDPRRIEEGFWRMARADKNIRALANQLFEGTVAGRTDWMRWSPSTPRIGDWNAWR